MLFEIDLFRIEIFTRHPCFLSWCLSFACRPVDPHFFFCTHIFLEWVMDSINWQVGLQIFIVWSLDCFDQILTLVALEPIIIVVFDLNDQITFTIFCQGFDDGFNLSNLNGPFERILFLFLHLFYVNKSFVSNQHNAILPLVEPRLLADWHRQ